MKVRREELRVHRLEVLGRDVPPVRGDALEVAGGLLVVGEGESGPLPVRELGDQPHRGDAGQRQQLLPQVRKKARRSRSPGYFPNGMDSSNVSTSLPSYPGSTRCSAMKLRISSPAPTSSTTESATSATIRRLRARRRSPALPPRPPDLRCSCGIGARRPERRYQAEQHRGHRADHHREQQHRAVHPDVGQPRKVAGWRRRSTSSAASVIPRPSAPPYEREQQALAEHLADHRPATRAQRGAERELRLPGGAPHQQQVGHVGAGDEQHHPTAPRRTNSAGRACFTTS